jgi:lipopolysaccharide transport system permease protein
MWAFPTGHGRASRHSCMTENAIVVYAPESALSDPRRLAWEMWRDLLASRELGWILAVRDIRAQYRQAFLGVLWAFMVPLANAAIWIFLSRSGVVAVGSTALPYPAYVLIGTMLWAILIDAINAPLLQTMAARSMLTKLNFPREALLLSGIYQTLVNAAIKVTLLAVALIVMQINPGWHGLFFPLGVLSLVLVGTAIGLLLTPVGTLYTDVGKALPVLMQFLIYLSPVVFPMPKCGMAEVLFRLNPLTPLIVTTRDWLSGTRPLLLESFFVVNAGATVLLLFVWVAYRLAMPILVERMSA